MPRIWLVVALIALASPALADESLDAIPPPIKVVPARPFDGAGQHRVPLVVPSWHGLEPALAISYASSTRHGWVGAGMTLEGVSMIERVSARLGTPTYTAADTYLLDGEPMIACVGGSPSPSCLTGGTHTTKHERYARIVKSGTTWTVTSPDGVAARYTTLAEPVAVVTSRTDLSGNTVTYSYATATGTSYLTSIAYNGTTIAFAREARPDVLTLGVGTGLRRIEQRLIGIAIRTDGALVRAYRLGYTSGGAGRSYLTSVKEYGSDATTTAAGQVTAGSALPATSFTYNPDLPPLGNAWSTVVARPTVNNHYRGDVSLVADVNGDGRGDAIAIYRQSTASIRGASGTLDVLVQLGRADGTFAPATVRTTTTANADIGWYDDVRAGDVNGDGKADLVFVQRQSTYACCGRPTVGFVKVQLALGTTTGGFSLPAPSQLSVEGESNQFDQVSLADLNGDGRSDLVLVRAKPVNGVYGDIAALVSLSTGAALGPAVRRTLASGGGSFADARVHTGDVNGDGRDDLVVVLRGSSVCNYPGSVDLARAETYLSAGDGTFGARVASTLNAGCNDSYVGDALVDVNGDGLLDLVGDQAFSILGACTDCDSDVTIVANLGTGSGAFGAPLTSMGWSGAGVGIGGFTAGFVDLNGDGFVDRVAARGGTSLRVLINYGRGDGTFAVGAVTTVAGGASTDWANGGPVTFGDIDGDGRLAVVATFCDGVNWRLLTLAPSTQFGGLLKAAAVPSGGSVQLDYTTSSSFVNGYLPFGFPVLASSRVLDGRGQIATTTYSYTGGLYVPAERRFFGFATARITDPAGAIRDVAYTQHVADPPDAIASTHTRLGSGAVVTYEATTFARGGDGVTAPYTSNPSRRYAYDCNGLPTCKAASRGWTYSAYGAVTSEIEYGDDAITGDERTTFKTQVVNPTAFITQLDATITVRAGAGDPTGTQLAFTELAYDGGGAGAAPTRGLVTQRSRWRGATSYVVERSQYDAAGNETATIDPLGYATTKIYDARHRLVGTTNPLGHTETRTYDGLGRVATVTDPNAGVTRTTYDVFSRAISRTSPDGRVATAVFTNWGNPATQYVTTTTADGSADGLWTRTYLDGLGRKVRIVAEGGITTDTTYDLRGQVASVTAPYLTGATPVRTTTSYDVLGRVRVVTEPDGAVTTTSYGNWSETTTDHRGLVTDRYVDGYRQLVKVVERLPVAQTTTIAYDLLGRRVTVVDAEGNTTSSTYDPLGRRVQSQDPDLGLWQYTYDDAGRVTTQRDARDVTLDFTYDALGRPRLRRAGTTTLAAFTYDEVAAGFANVGRLTSFVDPTGATRRDYDAAGRLRAETKTIGAATFQLDWDYDGAGRLAAIVYPEVGGVRERVPQTYDASGRVASVGAYVGGLGYDARGNVTAATYGNGATVARSYSPTRGWLMAQTVTAGAVVRDQFTVTRATSGDVTGRTSTTTARDAWQFEYDPLGRLTAADNTADDTLDEAFTYDPLGARLSARRGAATTAYQYPAAGAARPHAPTTVGGVTVRYDANGNRLGIGPGATASYDATNRLVDDGTTTYAYDAEGTRVRAGSKVFVRELFEADGASSSRYYYLGRERVARRDQAGAVAYYHGDSIGTVRTLTSATGAVAGTKLGFAFGELVATTGVADPFGIAGQRQDASGLYHMGARMMDPALGQFTQPDPSGAPDPARPQSLNRYTYAANNPIRLSDPTGFQEQDEQEREPPPEPAPPAGAAEAPQRPAPPKVVAARPAGTVVWERYDLNRKTWETVRRPQLYSETWERERSPSGGTSGWAHESVTGRVYSDMDRRTPMIANPSIDQTVLHEFHQQRAEIPGIGAVPQVEFFEDVRNHVVYRSDVGDDTLTLVRPGAVPASGIDAFFLGDWLTN
ncbi:MAG: FG-GAP-like repeat-containing protein [Kofleriaceae bacterium]